jgi:metallo-beta-lactamase superfamily protein
VRVAERWFEHESVDEDIVRITEPHVDPFLRANLFLVRGRERDLLVDAGLGLVSLREELAELFERPVVAVATHRHFDHTGGLHEFDEVIAHRDDAPAIARADGFASLRIEEYTPEELSGYEPPASLLTALPRDGYDVSSYRVEPVEPTRVLEEGDLIDLGDAGSRCCIFPATPPARSVCGSRRREPCSPATAYTRAACCSTSCPSQASRTTFGAWSAFAISRCRWSMADTTKASGASASSSSSRRT